MPLRPNFLPPILQLLVLHTKKHSFYKVQCFIEFLGMFLSTRKNGLLHYLISLPLFTLKKSEWCTLEKGHADLYDRIALSTHTRLALFSMEENVIFTRWCSLLWHERKHILPYNMGYELIVGFLDVQLSLKAGVSHAFLCDGKKLKFGKK